MRMRARRRPAGDPTRAEQGGELEDDHCRPAPGRRCGEEAERGRFYPRGVVGGDRHHRRVGRSAAARRPGGPRGGSSGAMPKQSETIWAGLDQPRECARVPAERRLGLELDRRSESRVRQEAARVLALQYAPFHGASVFAHPRQGNDGRNASLPSCERHAAPDAGCRVPLPIAPPGKVVPIKYGWTDQKLFFESHGARPNHRHRED
jgi:hypothetical protein